MKSGLIKEIISWILWMAGGLVLAFILVTFVFRLTVVKGESMNETLQNEQVLYVDKLSYNFISPNRGDIVICEYPNSNQKYIKRVIGLPGETIYIKDSVVYINGVAGIDLWNGNHDIGDMNAVQIPDGYYFVMGDNRSNSSDSREKSVGPISEEAILGRALFSISPIGKIEFKTK